MDTHSCGVLLEMCSQHKEWATGRTVNTAGENKNHCCARSVSCLNADFSLVKSLLLFIFSFLIKRKDPQYFSEKIGVLREEGSLEEKFYLLQKYHRKKRKGAPMPLYFLCVNNTSLCKIIKIVCIRSKTSNIMYL